MSGPSPIVSVRDPELADRDVVDPQQRRAAAREPEEALEADREVEVAARVQPALAERLDAGELALAELEPGLGVGADHDVGLACGRAGAHAGAERGAAHLPASARCRPGGRGRSRRSPARRRGSGRAAYGRPPRPGPKGPASRATYPWAGWVRSGPCPTSLSTTPAPARCSRSSPATHRGWESTPAGRRSTRGSTSATRGRSSSSRSSSASSSTRATASSSSANITDINDKIYVAAREAGRRRRSSRPRWPSATSQDTDRLGLGRPDAEPLASEYVGQIIALIADLVERGHAYAVSGDVYFRVRSLDSYGELSRRDVDQMDQGEGVEGADLKEDPLDFALWKAWKEGEDTSWDSPWGQGRPGWHIECSAMAEALLGVEFDIHGGGIDLVFPHHENEAAQTFAARGAPLARIWMHNGMLELGGKDVEVRRQHPRAARGARRGRRRRADPVLQLRPLPPAAGATTRSGSRTPGGRRSGSARPGGG